MINPWLKTSVAGAKISHVWVRTCNIVNYGRDVMTTAAATRRSVPELYQDRAPYLSHLWSLSAACVVCPTLAPRVRACVVQRAMGDAGGERASHGLKNGVPQF